MTLAGLILGLVTLQRLGELALSKRNADRLCVQGAYEVAAGHYPLIVALHTAWLTGLWYLVIYRAADSGSWVWLGVFVILQLLRVWVIATLGPRWTTRIIVLPGAPLVAVGPYRFVSHPNYWVVAAEILVLPLVFGLVWYGIAFSVLNMAVLWIRIRAGAHVPVVRECCQHLTVAKVLALDLEFLRDRSQRVQAKKTWYSHGEQSALWRSARASLVKSPAGV